MLLSQRCCLAHAKDAKGTVDAIRTNLPYMKESIKLGAAHEYRPAGVVR